MSTHKDKDLYVEINKLDDKRYEPDILYFVVAYSWMDEDVRYIKKKELRKVLMKALNINSRKVTRLINNFIALGILEIKGYDYIVHKAKPPYLNIPIPTVKFCLEHMGDLDFKIYCVLLNMYNKHEYYGYKENYFFTKKELLESIGYINDSHNLHIVDEALVILKKLGCIAYAGPKRKKQADGRLSKGYYFELLHVNRNPKAKEEADRQFLTAGGRINRQNYLDFSETVVQEEMKKISSAKNVEVKETLLKPQVQEKKSYSTEIVVGEFNGEKTLDGKRWYDLDNDTREFNHEDGFNELCLAIRGFCLGEDYSIEKSSKLSQLSIKIWGKDYTTVLEEKPDYSDLF